MGSKTTNNNAIKGVRKLFLRRRLECLLIVLFMFNLRVLPREIFSIS